MKVYLFRLLVIAPLLWGAINVQCPAVAAAPLSSDSEDCLECHGTVYPGIAADWRKSLHARSSLAEALKKEGLERRVSLRAAPAVGAGNSIGCAECHCQNPDRHKDSFDHNGYRVHVVVTPDDCATCHPVEADQYSRNIMSHAWGNLAKNPLYCDLADSVNGTQTFDGVTLTQAPPDAETNLDSCYFCHGSVVEVTGLKERDTVMGEAMEFPVLSGWPNQGVGRVNPDGSLGSCAACHTRHRFSMEMARKPETCAECHKGPDVPAYNVYKVSKHGALYSTHGKEWDFDAVPWTVGEDFTAPTCAACHVSLIVAEGDEVVASRTHQMNERNPWRLFGLVYAHPHPESPDTSVIRNRAGLPLPTELTGEPAPDYLIGPEAMKSRRKAMQSVCLSCHSPGWVEGHFARLDNTIKTTNEMTLTGTRIIQAAWERGVARGPAQKESPFDEAIEKMWVEQWLFFASSTRFASAMIGADYGVFENGRWFMSKNLREMAERLETLTTKAATTDNE